MSESLIIQLIGWATTLGASMGYVRARLNDLADRTKRLEEKVDYVKGVCDRCMGEKDAEKEHDA